MLEERNELLELLSNKKCYCLFKSFPKFKLLFRNYKAFTSVRKESIFDFQNYH